MICYRVHKNKDPKHIQASLCAIGLSFQYRERDFLRKSLAPLAKENPYNTFMQAYVP